MALTAAALSTELQTDLAAVLNITDAAQLKKVCDAIALAIVTRIKADSVVTGTVTTGVGAGGAILGSIS